MSAIRLARAATGREKLLKFAGAYHGHVDGLLAEAGSGPGDAGRSRPARASRRRATASTVVVPWNDPDGRRRGRRRARVRRDPRRALSRPTWASSRPTRASSSCCASAPTATGALLVFDEVITGFRVAPRRRPGADGRHARPDRHGQGHRRRPARRGLRRPARADGAHRARRRRLPGRHAVRATRSPSPPGWRRCALLDEQRLPAPRGARPRRSPTGLREAAGDRARAGRRPRPGLLTVFFSAEPVARLRRRPGAATSRPTPPGAAALLARGVYPPPSQFEAWFPSLAHDARARRAHARGRRGGVRGGRVRERARGACAAPAARRGRPAGRRAGAARRDGDGALGALAAAGPRAAAARPTSRSSSRRSARATCCTTAPAAARRATTPTSRCSPATGSTRSGLARLAAPGDLEAVASWPTSSRSAPRPAPTGAPSWPTPSGRRASWRSAGARPTRCRPPRPRRGRAARESLALAARAAVSGSRAGRRLRRLRRAIRFAVAPMADRPPTDQDASTPPTARSPAPSRARPSRAGAS